MNLAVCLRFVAFSQATHMSVILHEVDKTGCLAGCYTQSVVPCTCRSRHLEYLFSTVRAPVSSLGSDCRQHVRRAARPSEVTDTITTSDVGRPIMKKIITATVVGGAGVALLLGGAGTFALWNTSAESAGGTIVAGAMSVKPTSQAAEWTVDGGSPLSTLDGYPIVPGDVVTYTQHMVVTAKGKGLTANLAVAPASVEATSTSTPADVALAKYLSANAQLTASGDGVTAGATPSAPYTVTGQSGNDQNITVGVTITFPKSSTPGIEDGTQLGSVNLDAVAVTLTQA